MLSRIDAEALDAALSSWAQAPTKPAVIAVDGKEIRGAKNGGGTTVRLLAAVEHERTVVIGQVEVGTKTNEIPQFSVLLDGISDLAGVVVTADALHAQCSHAGYLHERGAHYLLTVKGNQPGLHRQLKSLPWGQVPVGHRDRQRAPGEDHHPHDQSSDDRSRYRFPARGPGPPDHPPVPPGEGRPVAH